MFLGKAFILTFGLSSLAHAQAPKVFDVDKSHSSIIYKSSHLGFSNSYGRFNDVAGTLVIDKVNPEKNKIDVTVKTASVDSFDQKRDEHLRSPDYFNVKQFPVMTFKSTKFTKVSDKVFDVTGDFTLLGVTKPMTLKVEYIGEGKDPWGGYRIGYETKLKIKRSDFGMKFDLANVGDEAEVIIAIEGLQKS